MQGRQNLDVSVSVNQAQGQSRALEIFSTLSPFWVSPWDIIKELLKLRMIGPSFQGPIGLSGGLAARADAYKTEIFTIEIEDRFEDRADRSKRLLSPGS